MVAPGLQPGAELTRNPADHPYDVGARNEMSVVTFCGLEVLARMSDVPLNCAYSKPAPTGSASLMAAVLVEVNCAVPRIMGSGLLFHNLIMSEYA